MIYFQGFRQTSLKTCSEVSPWTKVCEVQAPADLAGLLQKWTSGESLITNVPEAIQILETSLSEPVTTFNSVYRQQKLKKTKLGTGNNTTEQECVDSKRTGLKPAYKSAAIITDKRKYKKWIHAGKSEDPDQTGHIMQNEDDLSIPVSHISITDDSSINAEIVSSHDRTMSNTNKVVDSSNEEITETIGGTNGSSNSGQRDDTVQVHAAVNGESETSQETNENPDTKRKKKKSNTRKHAKQDPLPTLDHTFAEGPDLTLTDIALFPYIQFFVAHASEIGCRDVLITIPFVLRWCRNMQDVPDMVETLSECGLTSAPNLLDDLGCDESVSLAMVNRVEKPQEAEFGKGKSR